MGYPKHLGLYSFYWRTIILPHLASLMGLVTLSFLVAAFGMATVGLGVPLIDAAMGEGGKPNSILALTTKSIVFLGLPETKTLLILSLLILMSLVGIAHSTGLFFQQYWAAWLAQKFRADIKLKLFEKILYAQYAYLTQKGRGVLLYDINNPSQAIYKVIDLFGRMLLPLMHIGFYAGLMLYLSVPVTLVMGLLGIFWVWKLRGVMGHLSEKSGREVYYLGREMGKVDVDSMDGIKVIKSRSLEPVMLQRQQKLLQQEWKPKLRLALLTRGVVLFDEGIAGLIVIILGVLTLGFHWFSLTFAELVVFLLLIRRLSPAFATFSSMYVEFNQERKNMEVIDEIFHHTPLEESGSRNLEEISQIALRGVYFHYPQQKDKFILENVDLTMKRGKITAIVGLSGSGKTTLANLLLAFYQPTKGQIFANGIDLRNLKLTVWRQKIGYVSQDVFLFNETIFQNIALWNTSLAPEDVYQAAQLVQLHDFIMALPNGYQTVVGDRGLRLSGGQAQRLSIAREILRKPDLLIFDEATSALDNSTENAVYETILAMRREAIVVVIAHRLRTVKKADQIVVLKHGQVEAIGQHDTLLKTEGLYAYLHRLDDTKKVLALE